MGELLKAAGNPSAPLFFAPGMAKSRACWARQNGRRNTTTNCAPHAVAYIKLGFQRREVTEMEGSHSLEKFSNEIARDVSDPETKLSTWKRARLKAIEDAKSTEDRENIRQQPTRALAAGFRLRLQPAFLQHDGVASLNIGFGDEDGGGTTIRSTRFLLVHAFQRCRFSLRPCTGANRRHAVMPWRMRSSCLLSLVISPKRWTCTSKS